MERKLKIGLFIAPLAAVAVALGTLFWIPGPGGEISSISNLPWPSFASQSEAIPTEPARLAQPEMIELEVKDVIPIEEANTHAVVLVSKDNGVMLPIFVTEEAAVSIAFRLAERASPHPLAADLLDDVVKRMGGKVTEVRIDSVKDDIYTSSVTIKQGGQDLTLDARPSDAIAMALTGHAKIFCEKKVLAQAGITRDEIDSLREEMGVGGAGPEEGLAPNGPGNAIPSVPDDSNIRL